MKAPKHEYTIPEPQVALTDCTGKYCVDCGEETHKKERCPNKLTAAEKRKTRIKAYHQVARGYVQAYQRHLRYKAEPSLYIRKEEQIRNAPRLYGTYQTMEKTEVHTTYADGSSSHQRTARSTISSTAPVFLNDLVHINPISSICPHSLAYPSILSCSLVPHSYAAKALPEKNHPPPKDLIKKNDDHIAAENSKENGQHQSGCNTKNNHSNVVVYIYISDKQSLATFVVHKSQEMI